MPTIDWTALARHVGSIDDSGQQRSGTDFARAALEQIVTPEVFVSAVDHYVSGRPGGELARSVLWHCHPWYAMERCHELYTSSSDLDVRERAIELLRVVADRRALPWIAQYLEDPNPVIQAWGAGIVDQLLYSDLVEREECDALLRQMETHSNASVRERLRFIQQFLAEREETP